MNELIEQVKLPENQNYPSSMGQEDFREAVARWYSVRFNLQFDPESEITNVIGRKRRCCQYRKSFYKSR
ncbi:MAG: hypothetical protein ACTSPS_19660 [Promethearchaeota archaeon]